jgi:hypothetical protein
VWVCMLGRGLVRLGRGWKPLREFSCEDVEWFEGKGERIWRRSCRGSASERELAGRRSWWREKEGSEV